MAASEKPPTRLESIPNPQSQARLQVPGFLAEFERRLTIAQLAQEPLAEATAATE